MNKKHPKLSVIGLGKLGACYAAFYADNGFCVTGVDANPDNVRSLKAHKAPVIEPGLQKMIEKNKERLIATDDIGEAVRASDISYIIVPTPSLKDGSFSLKYILSACRDIGRALKNKERYHLVSLVSTVLPGDCRGRIIPEIEKHSGKTCGKDFGFCYNPSLIAIGDIIQNLSHPDFIFLGSFDAKSGDALARVFRSVYPDLLPERMSIESVELAKIALNSYITMKINFANTIAELSEKIPFARSREVTTALGKDKRIGRHYLSSGLGYGGPCFPRDNYAFAYSAHKRGVAADVALSVHDANEKLKRTLSNMVSRIAQRSGFRSIAFLGVSYKPNTPHTEASHALDIAKRLKKKFDLIIHEPWGDREVRRIFSDTVAYAPSIEAAIRKSEIVFVSHRYKPYQEELPRIMKRYRGKIIIDPWDMFSSDDFPGHIYKAWGRAD